MYTVAPILTNSCKYVQLTAVHQSIFIELVGAAVSSLGVPLGLYIIEDGKQHIFGMSGYLDIFYLRNFKTDLFHCASIPHTRFSNRLKRYIVRSKSEEHNIINSSRISLTATNEYKTQYNIYTWISTCIYLPSLPSPCRYRYIALPIPRKLSSQSDGGV